ncbi:JmjC domain-containing histone demethylation protein 1 [Trapelia coarctata]|nr:JmjC domain-containing histone demethylation protein 1 [Trapelia coarctata]
MAFNSFRRDGRQPPPRYRTPSPPPRRDVSPLSPRTHEGASSTPRRNGTNSGYKSARRNFQEFDHLVWNRRLQVATEAFDGRQDSRGRPSKRARSEKLPSPQMGHMNSRPVTSYIQPSEAEKMEAELLLNFSREACFAVPRPPMPYGLMSSPSFSSSASKDRVDHLSAPGLTPYRTTYTRGMEPKQDSTQEIQEEARTTEGALVQHTLETPLLHEAAAPTVVVPEVERDHPVLGLDSSQPCSTSKNPSDSNVLNEDNAHLQTNGPHKKPGLNQLNSPIGELDTDCRDKDLTASEDKDLTQPEDSTELKPVNELQNTLQSDVQPNPPATHRFLEGIEQAAMGIVDDDKSNSLSNPHESVSVSKPSTTPEESPAEIPLAKGRHSTVPSVCAACNFSRNALTLETENDATSWISCDACKSWFHFACAGFKSEREVRGVDKYRCRKCKPTHGPTTYVRKSARAHSAIDYAGLNEGVLKTSDESPEHHYIKPIKDGIIKFNPENFARMRPELVTAEYFQRGDGMKEPIVIPASLNPRPRPIPEPASTLEGADPNGESQPPNEADDGHDGSILDQDISKQFEYQAVPDYGQDALDMVIPQNLTVRKVSELYGPEEKVEVIDVKSQNGEDRKWNMRRWVDYYESEENKVVRNVISLEVSQSKLGRLIKRPKVVRDLDLQDSVWPAELIAKGDYPKVQFYCLMSVADCFTDFHIDFGGSSVFYHILKGKKTFFFIPPYEKHLKKYEEWCKSPAQNWTFLGDQTKECYRVDLSEGDTMLIPAGWIHAVWTPEDSLVIGGNFLTNMHYEMQIRVAQIEKVTGVARKFRYPHFQKLLWHAALKYLEDDPLPDSVSDSLLAGQTFPREKPTHLDFDARGENSHPGPENYHARYYSKAELDGLPELGRYLQRTALIANGSIAEGISVETRNAVRRSIPKGKEEPLDVVKRFAVWYTWKRGKENVPHWAYPEHVPEGKAPELGEKKLSAAALRRLDREAALQAWRIAPDRQSARRRSLPHIGSEGNVSDAPVTNDGVSGGPSIASAGPSSESRGTLRRKVVTESTPQQSAVSAETPSKKQSALAKGSTLTKQGPACETCRKRRRACKHRAELVKPAPPGVISQDVAEDLIVVDSSPVTSNPPTANSSLLNQKKPNQPLSSFPTTSLAKNVWQAGELTYGDRFAFDCQRGPFQMSHIEVVRTVFKADHGNPATMKAPGSDVPLPALPTFSGLVDPLLASPIKTPGRTKACEDCRRSKRRCIHDENGNEDPVKAAEALVPRHASASKKRKAGPGAGNNSAGKKAKASSTTVAADESIMTKPQTTGIMARAAERLNALVTEPTTTEASEALQSNMELAQQAMQQVIPPTNCPLQNPESLPQKIVTITTDIPLDPQLSESKSPATTPIAAEEPLIQLDIPPIDADDEFHHLATSPLSELDDINELGDLKWEPDFDHPILSASPSFQQPPASSLVSPPASHTEAERTPPAPSNMQTITPSATSSSSRHSSRANKTVQRYTPESGSMRQNSTSSAGVEGAKMREGGSPVVNSAVKGEGEGGSAQKKGKSRRESEVAPDADEESMRLIRELQAQDMGLRRRARG